MEIVPIPSVVIVAVWMEMRGFFSLLLLIICGISA